MSGMKNGYTNTRSGEPAFRITWRRRKKGIMFLDDQRVTADFSPVEKNTRLRHRWRGCESESSPVFLSHIRWSIRIFNFSDKASLSCNCRHPGYYLRHRKTVKEKGNYLWNITETVWHSCKIGVSAERTIGSLVDLDNCLSIVNSLS